jgi:hypothetical protein
LLDGAGRPAIANARDAGDAGFAPPIAHPIQLKVEAVDRQPSRDRDDGVRRQVEPVAGEQADELRLATFIACDRHVRHQLDPHAGDPLGDGHGFERIDGPGRHDRGWSDDRHTMARVPALLGKDAAHVIMIVVPDDDGAILRISSGHQVVGRVDRRTIEARKCETGVPADSVATPHRTRGDRNVPCTELQDMLGPELAVAIDGDVGHPFELGHPPVANAGPFGEPRESALFCDSAAQLGRRFGQMHFEPSPSGRQRRLEARGSRPNDEHGAFRLLRSDDLRVPAATPFLAHRRVLGAAEVRRSVIARHAHVAADAFADLVDPAFLDLLRQEGVRDRRARGADEVEDAAPDLRDHRIG